MKLFLIEDGVNGIDKMIYRIVLPIVGNNPDDALDIVQDTLLKAHGSFPNQSPPRSWFLKVGKNLAIDLARRKARRKTSEFEDAPSHDPEANFELQSALDKAVSELPEQSQKTYTMFYVDGHSCDEISAKLGIPVGTVKSRLSYIRMKLQDQLGRFQ